jgi:hypothetical protein
MQRVQKLTGLLDRQGEAGHTQNKGEERNMKIAKP